MTGFLQKDWRPAWLLALEEAFRHWGGVPQEVLMDNARALVLHDDPANGSLEFHPRLVAFAKHWGFTPKTCRPHRPRTKGKDERGVRYVNESGLANHDFPSWQAMEAHLKGWNRQIADQRRHGTTGEAPLLRFEREEAAAPRRSADHALLRDRPARSTAVKRAAVLTAEQISAMLAAASPRDAALVVLMCVGAMRVGEATLLAWSDVEECSITIPGGITKTGASRRFTRPPAACKWLQEWRQVCPTTKKG